MSDNSAETSNREKLSVSELLKKEENILKEQAGIVELEPVYKIILAGDGAVGKSSMVDSMTGHPFSETYIITMGCQFNNLSVELPDLEKTVKLQIWDLSGQPHFSEVRKQFYNGTDLAVLVIDLSRLAITFENIPEWISEILDNSESPSIPMIIVGNKVDTVRNDEKASVQQEIDKYLLNLQENVPKIFNDGKPAFIPASAKVGLNIKEIFQLAAIKAVLWRAKNP
ncbi:MAG: Rab family GTPase [Candidatus Odinarchaeota archaeon]